MDKRYLYSWLTFIGVMGVAWLMSQMDDGSDRRQAAAVWTGTTPGAGSAGGVSSESGGVGLAGGSQGSAGVVGRDGGATGGGGPLLGAEPRRLAAGGASPTIPGLMDDEFFGGEGVGEPSTARAGEGPAPAQFDLENPATESARIRSGVSATVPLRPAGMERAKSAGEGGLTPLPAGAPALDGSTPERRAAPTFSMPNTQRAEPAGPSLSDVSTQSGGDVNGLPNESRSDPGDRWASPLNRPADLSSGVGQGLALRPLSSGPSAETPSGAALQPQFLPGERHVLRPIMRSGLPVASAASSLPSPPAGLPSPAGAWSPSSSPAGSTVGGSSLAGMSSAAGPASVWDAPMPGVKAGGGSAVAPTVPAFGNTGGHDPLFVQVAEGLARESSAGVNPPSGGAFSPAAAGNAPRSVLVPDGALAPATSLSPGTGTASGVGAVRPGTRGVGRPRGSSGDYIWHEIRQNQTLESISLQYQGDTSLAGPIAELNRDILPDPQLLPIGRAIRVPIR